MNQGTQVQPFCVSVLLHRDGDAWVAQCLEKDLAAQGPNPEEAKKRFLRALGAQIAWDLQDKREPLSNLPQAPQRYFEKSVFAAQFGPELPVFVPVTTEPVRINAQARFLKAA